MAKKVRIPNLPATITKQPSGLYRDCKSGKVYTLNALKRIYGDKKESVKPPVNDDIIQQKRWDLNY